jgi:hypothetical protein
MYKVVELEAYDVEGEVKVPPLFEEGASAKASQEGTFDDANRNKTVAVAVAALITVLLLVWLLLVLVEEAFIM